jgi:hypothetical protein
MKYRSILKRALGLLAICFASAWVLSACHSTEEHPSAEHPTTEHPEHPATNAPPKTP